MKEKKQNNQHKDIRNLFQENGFKFKDFPEDEEKIPCDSFNCENRIKKTCNVTQEEPKYTCAIGDFTKNSNIMIIAEAPSATGGKKTLGGKKAFCMGKSKNTKSPVKDLIEFIKDQNEYIYPYFTDLIKCGLVNQSKENKKKLDKRVKPCTEKFLMEEIKILQPSKIYCVGKMAYRYTKEFFNSPEFRAEFKMKIPIQYLFHYSNQNNLPLNISDKKDLIWKLQTESIKPQEAKEKVFTMVKGKLKPPEISNKKYPL